jgi:DNA-binding transcriptional regulator YdaS (Cro superfamily)
MSNQYLEESPAFIIGEIKTAAERVYGRAPDAFIAETLGVTPASVSLWRSGARRMSKPTRLLAARIVAELQVAAHPRG